MKSLSNIRDQPSRSSLLQPFEHMIGFQTGTCMKTDALPKSFPQP